jgi:hypothetical protein
MHLEVELTAEITGKQRDALRRYLARHRYRTMAKERRFMVRFHREKLNPRDPLDIRYKWINGNNQLTIKKGALGSQGRQELHVPLGKGNKLDEIVKLFMLLGYRTGNAMNRTIEHYRNDSFVISLTEALPYYFIEVETLHAASKRDAVVRIKKFFVAVKLRPLGRNSYLKAIRRLDREINLNFPLAEYPKPFMRSPEWKKVLESTVLKR